MIDTQNLLEEQAESILNFRDSRIPKTALSLLNANNVIRKLAPTNKLVILKCLLWGLWFWAATPISASALEPVVLDYKIQHTLPHSTRVFTQGLEIHEGQVFESSGLYGKSFIQRYTFDNVTPRHTQPLPKQRFAEGLTNFGNHLYLLTWKAGEAHILDPVDFNLIRVLQYSGEGWGITHNEHALITSDGSANLTYRSAEDFSALKTLSVTRNGQPVERLNELEYAKGYIWANIWQSDKIVAIDPATGIVTYELHLGALVKLNSTQINHTVLNGIAYDAKSDTFWITGKLWPNLYQIHIELPKAP